MKCVIFWLLQCRGSGFQHPLGQPSQLSLSHSVSAGPIPECQKPSEKCSFFPQGYSRFFKKKEVTALAAVIFILQLTEPSSKEVSGILFKFFFFSPKSMCFSHWWLRLLHRPPRSLPSLCEHHPPQHPQQAEGGHPFLPARGTGDRQSSARRRHWLQLRRFSLLSFTGLYWELLVLPR